MARRHTSDLEALYRAHPDSLVFARVADAYLAAGRSVAAVEVCLRGLDMHPSYATGHYVLAKCYIELGQYDSAKAALGRVRGIDPDHIGSLDLLAGLCEKTGDEEGAVRFLRALNTVDPLNPGVTERISRLGACVQAAPEVPGDQKAHWESQGQFRAASVDGASVDAPSADPGSCGEATGGRTGDGLSSGADSAVVEEIVLAALPPSSAEEGLEAPDLNNQRASAREPAVQQDVNRLIREIGMGSGGVRQAPTSEQTSAGNPHPGIATVTLAELYASQGVLGRSIEILKSLLLQNPDDKDIEARIRELETRQSTSR